MLDRRTAVQDVSTFRADLRSSLGTREHEVTTIDLVETELAKFLGNLGRDLLARLVAQHLSGSVPNFLRIGRLLIVRFARPSTCVARLRSQRLFSTSLMRGQTNLDMIHLIG